MSLQRVGLVLSGDMGKGAYQVGALKAIKEYFSPDEFDVVSAASIGVLNTYTFLTGNLDKARELWGNIDFKGSRKHIMSILKSDFLQGIVDEISSGKKIGPAFYVPLLDVAKRQLFYHNFSEVSPNEIRAYLKASVAMPFYNRGVEIEGRKLYDGAVVDNIPIYPVMDKNLDYIIVIHFDDRNYIFEDPELNKKVVKLTFHDKKFITNSIHIRHDSVMQMIEEGYSRTEEKLAEIFKNGKEDIPAIYAKIEEANESDCLSETRITGDVIVSNINKFTKKLIRNNNIID